MQKLNLFINHYQCGDIERQKELDFCFKTNKESGIFSEIINFSNRPKYNDFFKASEAYPDDINILANSDIYFNQTIKMVKAMDKNQAFALTRWEIDNGDIVPFEQKHTYNAEAKAKHSQDVWVFNGAVTNIQGDFHIGMRGCDNRIAFEINRRYKLSNPSDRIQCIHKHAEEKRNYSMPHAVPPPYLWVDVEGVEQPRRRSRI